MKNLSIGLKFVLSLSTSLDCVVFYVSAKQAQEILDKKEEACNSFGTSNTQSPKSESPVNMEHRKILTPKGSSEFRV